MSVVKPKPKLLLWPIEKEGNNPVNQSKLEVITRSRHKARENVHARATIDFGFNSDWLKKWRANFEPITESFSEVIINQSNSLITFDTQLKTALARAIERFVFCVMARYI